MSEFFHYASYAVAAGVLGLLFALRKRRSNLPYPPGPKGLPLIGNVQDLPSERQWLTYTHWSRQYSTSDLQLHAVPDSISFKSLT